MNMKVKRLEELSQEQLSKMKIGDKVTVIETTYREDLSHDKEVNVKVIECKECGKRDITYIKNGIWFCYDCRCRVEKEILELAKQTKHSDNIHNVIIGYYNKYKSVSEKYIQIIFKENKVPWLVLETDKYYDSVYSKKTKICMLEEEISNHLEKHSK